VDCTDAIYNLGMAMTQMKEYASARKQFDKFLNILPDHPDALYQVATIQVTQPHRTVNPQHCNALS